MVFTRHGVRHGARTALPLLLGLTPFALVVGVIAAGKGLSLVETLVMSGLVFAGSSQLLALELWTDPAPILAATLAAAAANIRMAPMGAALAPWLNRLSGWKLWGSLGLMVDHSFALSVTEMRAGGRDAGFLLGIGLVMYAAWLVAVAAGHLLGGAVRLPPGHPFLFAGAATFVALLAAMWRGPRADLLPWGLTALLALLLHRIGLPAPLPLLAAALAGAALAAWLELRHAPAAPAP
ncbi:azaleucine resistance protein AzlC [Pseudoroseomonas oryzae]|uniref:Azaleucine resistance protein AzlC n=1 Tax=Teichococcus oryzae TaxID=1608942 RepID=A0A5B2TM20_9PROT|nr:azaleucine resistance protein AzlC [Pseudoroseomonas oryzae]